MSKRTSRARVSYVEVDSDIDIASSDNEAVQGSSGAMAAKTASGAAKGKSKGQGRMTGARECSTGQYGLSPPRSRVSSPLTPLVSTRQARQDDASPADGIQRA